MTIRRAFLIASPLLVLSACGDPTAARPQPAAQLDPQLAFMSTATTVDLLLGDAEVTEVGAAANGTVALTPDRRALVYSPKEGYVGLDSVAYAVRGRPAHGDAQRMLRLRVLPGPYQVVPIAQSAGFIPYALNDAGTVAGDVLVGDRRSPATWNGGVISTLDATGLDSASARWIGDAGAVAGVGHRSGRRVGVLWQTPSSVPAIIAPSGYANVDAVMVDGTGSVVVDSTSWNALIAVNSRSHRLVRNWEAPYPLAIVYDGSTQVGVQMNRDFPEDLNDSVDVVGRSGVGTYSAASYLWNPVTGVRRDLTAESGGMLAQPLRISNARVIAGVSSEAAPGGAKPALFAEGAWEPLVRLLRVEDRSDWSIDSVVDMNDRHEILVHARRNGGAPQVVLLAIPR